MAGPIDAWLKWWRPKPVEPDPQLAGSLKQDFVELLNKEADGLRKAAEAVESAEAAEQKRDIRQESESFPFQPTDVEVPASGEPWVATTTKNYVGLALSGGGIRSATFNLGLLQGLDRLHLLPVVSYLSTVSGGGYIGGFWSAWLARGKAPAHWLFPGGAVEQRDPSRVVDTPEVRHLREFSRFLAPRVGFFETEMWHAILAFAGGLIPTLTVTLSLIALTLIAWLGLTTYLANDRLICGLSLTVALAAIVLERLERAWSLHADKEARDAGLRANFIFALSGLAVTALAFWAQDAWLNSLAAGNGTVERFGVTWVLQTGSWAHWREGVFLAQRPEGLHVYLRVFEPATSWASAGAFLLASRLLVRGLTAPERRTIRSNALDRVIMRLFGMAIVWALAGTLWQLGVMASRIGWIDAWTALAAALSGGLFGILRNWLTTAFKQTGHRGFLERARPLLPMLLAYLTIGLGIVWVASLLTAFLAGGDITVSRERLEWLLPWIVAIAVLAGVLGIMVTLDPADYSLHAFYRDRIARAYLGATNPTPDPPDRAAGNRNAEARAEDDMSLGSLSDKPLHLICCAANDLSGDQVETLSRGSRSVTVSKYGIALGGQWSDAKVPTLAAALTASAAAFNPAMGSVSKKLGPAVTFLMAALNLRLGLWVLHPKVKEERDELRGRSLLRELLGRTHAGLFRDGKPEAPVVHLSDGAHFDNLGLYELVRRHCRYIIVSDCGADEEIAFDDLGNAVRRIREDFGVEIEIDLKPLRPTGKKRATQHAVVGTVHYDRHFDKGVIVYFKPTLAGDEPPDVRQYHRRNTAFPHEGTIDQFYDEAQWESYRRLGFHSAMAFFQFVERLDEPTADAIFTGARQEWFPTPSTLRERILESTARFGSIEEEIRADGGAGLLTELFPEANLLRDPRTAAPAPKGARPAAAVPDELATATYLLKAMQMMEDVWTQCDLDTQSKHPLNVGWVNAFARWATAPSFRRWWPVLSPSFSPGFQRFLREQFYQGDAALPPEGQIARRDLGAGKLPPGLAANWWTTRMKVTPAVEGRVAYEYSLKLDDLESPIQVGLVVGEETGEPGSRLLRWTSEDFFVPPSLWGGGLGSGFIRTLLEKLDPQIHTVEVFVVSRYQERSAMYREDRIAFVEFYRSAEFITLASGTRANLPPDLKHLLRKDDEVDAWTAMRWSRAKRARKVRSKGA